VARCRDVSCACVCVCVCLCWCPETRRLVQLTDPAPLSFWKNPAMATAEETKHPACHSAGGGSRRRSDRVNNAEQVPEGRQWIERCGGNHTVDWIAIAKCDT
jgi:hypothetical protein